MKHILLILALAISANTNALEVTAKSQAPSTVKTSSYEKMQLSLIKDLRDENEAIKICMAKQMFYAPDDAAADSDGCVAPPEPETPDILGIFPLVNTIYEKDFGYYGQYNYNAPASDTVKNVNNSTVEITCACRAGNNGGDVHTKVYVNNNWHILSSVAMNFSTHYTTGKFSIVNNKVYAGDNTGLTKYLGTTAQWDKKAHCGKNGRHCGRPTLFKIVQKEYTTP